MRIGGGTSTISLYATPQCSINPGSTLDIVIVFCQLSPINIVMALGMIVTYIYSELASGEIGMYMVGIIMNIQDFAPQTPATSTHLNHN